jgi:hypothetical protein
MRGDLKTISPEDKRAIILVARVVRLIFALVIVFNLNLR